MTDASEAAWLRARAVVGLYGDPTVPWSIVLQASLSAPLSPDALSDRLAALAEKYPHLGGAPSVVTAGEVDEVRGEFASRGYDGTEPLVRAALLGSPPVLLLAAHHGAVDGLGLLALLGAAVDRPVRTGVVGTSDRVVARSFALAAARRVGEAVFAPPMRVRTVGSSRPAPPAEGSVGSAEGSVGAAEGSVGSAEPAGSGEVLVVARLPRMAVGTAAVTAAVAAVVRRWNGVRGGRVVAAIGASRRNGDCLTPEHRSAYLRLRLPLGTDRALVRTMLDNQPLEPDFPPSRNVVVRLGARALGRRLGATFLASNLGAVEIGAGIGGVEVGSLAFFPQCSGPAGVAVGVVSTAGGTSITLRARRRDFAEGALVGLLERVVAAVRGLLHFRHEGG